MTEADAKILQDAIETQRRCENRLMVKDKEGEYRDAALWVTAQKVIDVLVAS